jgi:hypothetical protein
MLILGDTKPPGKPRYVRLVCGGSNYTISSVSKYVMLIFMSEGYILGIA